MDMSFQEKSAAISLLTILGVYGYYFYAVLLGAGPESASAMLGWMVGLVVVLVILELGFHVVVAVFTPRAEDAGLDERERLIRLKAYRVAHVLLSIRVLLVLGRILFGSYVGEEITLLDTANQLLLAFVIAESAHYGVQVYHFRRGG